MKGGHVISLGAGVQSTTLLLMAMHGEIQPAPAAAIFADTQWEPAAVYEHLAWLESFSTIPIIRTTHGPLRTNIVSGLQPSRIPVYVASGKAEEGRLARQCTKDYKIMPVRREIRRLFPQASGRNPDDQVVLWMGISTDEAARMKDSRVQYIRHRYPLALEQRMSRADCLAWMARHGYPRPPRSACIGCPLHSDDEWRNLAPADFADAVEFDHAIRDLSNLHGQAFLHRDLVPLDMVDLRTERDRGQLGNVGRGMRGRLWPLSSCRLCRASRPATACSTSSWRKS